MKRNGQSIVEYLMVTAGIIAALSMVVVPLLTVKSCAMMTTAIDQIGK